MTPKGAVRVFQLHVTLKGIRPPVWRRILVSERATLRDLHDVIQTVFGWLDYHLHEFRIRGIPYGDPETDESEDSELQDDSATKLGNLDLKGRERFEYCYDFGDDWVHLVEVELIRPKERGMRLPGCLGGGRACPPEDVGGLDGYRRFLKAIENPNDAEHDEYLTWVGGTFDPEAFDLAAVDGKLGRRTRPTWGGERPTFVEDAWAAPETNLVLPAPALPLPSEHGPACVALPLRRNVVALLVYLRDTKITGTQSTGNLPLKAVEEACQRFVEPPALETRIGEYVDRFRSEEDVWPLFFVHILANGARLVTGGPGRRWKLTEVGTHFLDASAGDQVWILFATWWYRINWLVACHFDFPADFLPEEFGHAVLQSLKPLSIGRSVRFHDFAEAVAAATGWKRNPDLPEPAWSSLYAMIQQTVVEPLAEFGVLAAHRKMEAGQFGEITKLEALEVTPLGQSLVASLV